VPLPEVPLSRVINRVFQQPDKPFVDEVFDELAIPRSFMPRPRRIMEDELDFMEDKLDFGSPRQPPRRVRASFVSCNRPSAAIAAITGPDPVGTIQAANTCAIELLDYVIRDLQDKRDKIRAGATTTETVEDLPARDALQRRFRMDADDRNIWTRSGARSVRTLIRRFQGARQILADGWMKYTCLGAAAPATVTISRGGEPCTVLAANRVRSHLRAGEILGSYCAGRSGGTTKTRFKVWIFKLGSWCTKPCISILSPAEVAALH
jgi:hypothetical protein